MTVAARGSGGSRVVGPGDIADGRHHGSTGAVARLDMVAA
jgi:hypothetical protein